MLARRKKFDRSLHDQLVLDHQRAVAEGSLARADLERLFDQIADREILELAMARARVKVRDKTWRVFVMVDERGEAVEDVALRMGLSRGAVHTAVYTVRKLIREEMSALDPKDC